MKNIILKQEFSFKCYMPLLFILCLILFPTCDNPENDTQPDTETQVEFTNLESFKVVLYSDSLRNNIFVEIAANSKETVSASPNNLGIVYYPTYYIDVPDIPYTSIPYNGEPIITVIEANKINKVYILQLENIVINKVYLKIINDSIHSLSLQQGGNEKVPLGGRPSIIASGQNAAYEISTGTSSSYTVMRNTLTPIDFPAGFTEFEKGNVYIFTYDGTNLMLTKTWPIPSPSWPTAPRNIHAESLSTSSVQLSWDAIHDATSYRVYRAFGSATASYSQIAVTNTPFYTNTGLLSDQLYYYKISAVKNSTEGERSNAVFVITINWANEANGTVTVINNTSKNLIIFQGHTPTAYNIIGGVRGLSTKTFNISDGVNNFQSGGYLILQGFTDYEYETNKNDLSKAKTKYLAMATYGQDKKSKVEINSYNIGTYAYRVSNLSSMAMELRKNGLSGEKIAYIPASAIRYMIYADSPDIFTVYSVFIVYSPSTAQLTILNSDEIVLPTVAPKPVTGNEIPEYNFNPLGVGTISSPVAYLSVSNNITNQSGQLRLAETILKSQNGYDTIDYGETLTFEIPSTDDGLVFNINLAYHDQTLQIPVTINGDMPELRNGYDYRISVSGSGPIGYTAVFAELGKRDLDSLY